ncbi:MAG: hypothetical protein QM767_09950 [Anaeromyxobacter sp.]
MNDPTYAIFHLSNAQGFALIDDSPRGMYRPMDLRRVLPVGVHWPATATCSLSKRKKGTKLADFFGNIMRALIVNAKARAVLEAEPHLGWEWYPIPILDQEKNPFSSDYTWAHLLGSHACVDRERSIFTVDPMHPAEVHTFERLVLDPEKIPPEPSLFRLREQPGLLIIRSDLVAKLKAAGVTGWETWPLDAPILL